MNETENRQRKVNQQMERRIPGKRKISQLLTKNDIQKKPAQKNWGMRESQMSSKNSVLQFMS